MKVNKLYIFCGYPFSGKTTLAREIVKNLHFTRVDIDEIILENGYTSFDDGDITPEGMDNMFEEFYQRITEALTYGENVLCDNSNPTRQGRDILKKLASKVGCSSIIIFVNTPKEIAKNRWEENIITKQRSHITEQTIINAFNEMQKPTTDEEVIEYLPQMNIDTWTTENLLHT